MKTIKKTTLIAAITAMAAFAVPSMASAAVWGPLNTNQSLDSSNATYTEVASIGGWSCSSHHLGVHVRTPASSTLDVTAASWSGCIGTGGYSSCSFTITPAGLPWTATATSSTNVALTEHAHVTFLPPCGSGTLNLDGTVNGTWSAATHKLTFNQAPGLTETAGGMTGPSVKLSGTFSSPSLTLT